MNALTRFPRNGGTFCLAAAFAVIAILEVPAADDSGSQGDLWDLSNGTAVTLASSVTAGFDTRDIFGGVYSGPAPGQCVFADGQAPGFVHFLEWRTAVPVEVGKMVLHASGDGIPFENQREFARFVLKAKLPGASAFEQVLIDYTPTHPYSFLEPTAGLVLSNTIAPVTAQDFRAEFTQFDTGSGFDGPRIKELDAFPPDCSPAPPGLVGWWRAEGDAKDEAGANDGSLVNGLGFGSGRVGQAFSFTESGQQLHIPGSAELAVHSLTFEAWIRPATVELEQPIIEYSPPNGLSGVHLWLSVHPEGYRPLPGSLFANVISADGISHLIATDGGLIQPGVWSHVALTYDPVSGSSRLFHNGVEVATEQPGGFVPRTELPLTLGHRLPGVSDDPRGCTFVGEIDEVSVYNRALSVAELVAIHAAGSRGKCPPSDCVDAPSGIVAWWQGEGDGMDAEGGHDGTLENGLGFAPGIVGQAFQFNAPGQHLFIPASVESAVQSLTLEAWIRPVTVEVDQPIIEYAPLNGMAGVHLWISVHPEGYGPLPGSLFANVISADGISHLIATDGGLIQPGVWSHVALTYDPVSGSSRLFHNGVEVATEQPGGFVPRTELPLTLGHRLPGVSDDPRGCTFVGEIDEVSVYNRALSVAELVAIHAAGSRGKCPPSDCVDAPSGIVAWWQGEGNGADMVGGHGGTLENGLGFATGIVRQAFQFNAPGQYLFIPASAELAVRSFTIEAWISPSTVLTHQPIVEFSPISGDAGVHLWLSIDPTGSWVLPGSLYANVLSEGGESHLMGTAVGVIEPGVWSHVALTYDHNTGYARLFHAGTEVASQDLGVFVPRTALPVFIGHRLIGNTGDPLGQTFSGRMDEVCIYDRALSVAEIAAIHAAGSHGKCPPAPEDCAPPAEGLLGWWTGEGSGWDELGLHAGEVTGATYAAGVVGQGFLFDGEEARVRVPFESTLSSTTFTVEAWVQPLGQVVDPLWGQDLIFGQALGSPTLLVRPGTEGVTPVFGFTVNPFLTPEAVSSVELPIGEFSHVAGSWDGTTLRIFVNGVLTGENAPDQAPVMSTCDYFIGGQLGNCAGYGIEGGFFQGAVDELSLYGRALAPFEIERIHAAGSDGKCRLPGYVLTVQASQGGTVQRDPEAAEYRPGQIVTLTAVAEAGFAFAYWEGAVTGTDPEVTVLIEEPKQVTAVFMDVAPPQITIESPVPGVTELQSFVLTGQVTDNLGLGPVRWEYNGQPLGTLPLTDGRFLVEALDLVLGENQIRIYALDVAGNEGMAEVVVEWVPARLLAVVDPEPRQEGLRLQVPIQLTSNGDVGGASFELRYNADYLKTPRLEWMPSVNSALNQVNTEVPGVVRATFALPALPVPAGTETLAVVSFRARSVPSSLDSTLPLSLLDISRPTGDPITESSATRSGTATILLRRLVGDNNANQRLDVGDATIVQRLLTGLELVRPWDTTGNDVNQNTQLDSGDVIRVLRAAVGLDPQPTPQSAGIGGTASRLSRHNLEPMSEAFGGALLLEADPLRAAPGELVTVRVRLDDVPTSPSAVALRLDYPVEALRLLNAQSHRVGALVPATAVAVWNVAPAQNDYAVQSGTVSLALSSAVAWPSAEGVLAEFSFQVQDGQSGRHQWPIRVSQAELSADGYDLTPIPDAAIHYVGRDPLPPQLTPAAAGLTEEGFAFSFLGETGLDYVVEVSTDLVEWSPLATHTGADATITVLDSTAIGAEQQFYRVRYVSAD
ncbi:MAG: hypothetical protein KJ072_18290 [Verrucomicrobia bacterium]|nr:hypothetical protein [Verrucomicrobiota bacterium]